MVTSEAAKGSLNNLVLSQTPPAQKACSRLAIEWESACRATGSSISLWDENGLWATPLTAVLVMLNYPKR